MAAAAACMCGKFSRVAASRGSMLTKAARVTVEHTRRRADGCWVRASVTSQQQQVRPFRPPLRAISTTPQKPHDQAVPVPTQAAWVDKAKGVLVSGTTAFAGLALFTLPAQLGAFPNQDIFMLVASFGSTACLVFGLPHMPASQPRNVFAGHVISATTGLSVFKTMALVGPELQWIGAPLATSLAIMCMQASNSMHPPAAGTSLLMITGSPYIQSLGWSFVATPIATGSLLLIGSGVVFNRHHSSVAMGTGECR
eukprot:m.91756 g.91756  ORF g.91756 m.91756 type:complete len:254 (+) comp15050_c0_seq1:886-1647(+)